MIKEENPDLLTESSPEEREIMELEMMINQQESIQNSPTEYLQDERVILSSMNRHNAVEKSRWSYKSRPLEKPAPTLVLHGIQQSCSEAMMTNLVDQITLGTNSHTECLEIGSGIATSYSSINDQAEFAC